ncbi:Crp/Fnr family transcriptional regulator [Streptomyces sp. NPDC005012]|uniref:Crp/Fnr family transcriptional regulator n=1 Tax=unclassified Streptomyces TaxID=2593676 RepID=UPI00339DB5DC
MMARPAVVELGGRGGRTAFWGLLDAPARKALAEAGQEAVYPALAQLVRQHDLTDHLLVVLGGCVRVSTVSAGGYQAVLALRGPGDLLGEQSGLDGRARSATLTALTPVHALRLPADVFSDVAQGHPCVSRAVNRVLSVRLREADRHRTAAGADSSAARLAGLLLELAVLHGRRGASGETEIGLPLSQDDLAGLVLGSRRTVSRLLEQWRREGWVTTGRNRIVLHDPDALKRVGEDGGGR